MWLEVGGRTNMNFAKPSGFPLPSADLRSLSDEELMQFLKNGRHEALTVLFDRYHHLVFSIA